MKHKTSSAVIFDMDGTLWDAIDNIVISWNKALAQAGETGVHVTREGITGFMGKTMDQFAKALLPHHPLERAMEIMQTLEKLENDYLREHGAVLYADVGKVFQKLHGEGHGVCIVSNCQSGYIEAFLSHYKLEELVDDFECYGNTGHGKADNLKLLIGRNHLKQYWYLGDTQDDYNACKEAGVPFIWASYGFGSVNERVPRIERLEEIADMI